MNIEEAVDAYTERREQEARLRRNQAEKSIRDQLGSDLYELLGIEMLPTGKANFVYRGRTFYIADLHKGRGEAKWVVEDREGHYVGWAKPDAILSILADLREKETHHPTSAERPYWRLPHG